METARRFSGQGGLLGTTKHRPWGQVSSWCSVHMSPATQDPPWSGREEVGRHCSGRPSPPGRDSAPFWLPDFIFSEDLFADFYAVWTSVASHLQGAFGAVRPIVRRSRVHELAWSLRWPAAAAPWWASVDLQSRAPASGGPPRRSRRAVPPRCVPSPVAKGLLVAVLLPCF